MDLEKVLEALDEASEDADAVRCSARALHYNLELIASLLRELTKDKTSDLS